MTPMYVARDLARQLRDDRVSASQVKEFIPVHELIDLLDLKDDRGHQTKRRRPMAAGILPIAPVLLALPVLMAATRPPRCS